MSLTAKYMAVSASGRGTRVWAEKYQNEFVLYCFLFLSCLIGSSALIFQEARKEKTRKRKIRVGRGWDGKMEGQAAIGTELLRWRRWTERLPAGVLHLSFSVCHLHPFGLSYYLFSCWLSSVQLLSHVRLFVTPWTAACQASHPSPTPGACSNSCLLSWWCHLILCHPLLLLPSVFPRIRVFSSESVLRIRWPKYWEFQLQHQSFQWIFRTYFL